MIVKFFSRGVGRGSGPVEYLLGRDGQRSGATLDSGNPAEIQALIDTSPYSKKYTSGVLSFAESDLSPEQKTKIMRDFEAVLLPGLDPDQYSILWVEHRDKDRLELNFVIPNINLLTGRRLQPWYEPADKPRIHAWKTITNAELNLHDPDDPANRRVLSRPSDLPKNKQQAAQAITDGLLMLAANGLIQQRSDIILTLETAGFQVARQTKNSISIADPDGGKNIRLTGAIYEQIFRHGAELRGEIESAGQRYRAERQERIRQSRTILATGIEIQRAANGKRHKRPESAYAAVGSQDMVVAGTDADNRFQRDSGGAVVAISPDPLKPAADPFAGAKYPTVERSGRKNTVQQMRQTKSPVRSGRPEPAGVRGFTEIHDFRGVLTDDGVRKTAIERIRGIAAAARAAAQGICDSIRGFGYDVRAYISRQQTADSGGQELGRAGSELEQAVKQFQIVLDRKRSDDLSRGMR